jgi:hypothetical protein
MDKNKRLFWIACLIHTLFILPFIKRIVFKNNFEITTYVKDDFLLILFVFIPIQIFILSLSIYINTTIFKNWNINKKKLINIVSVCLTLPILFYWIVIFVKLIFIPI